MFAALLGACGKKGPPLAPIVRIPAEVTTITAQRVGNEFYLTLTVPTTNIDMTMPVVVPVKWVDDTPVVTMTEW